MPFGFKKTYVKIWLSYSVFGLCRINSIEYDPITLYKINLRVSNRK